MVVLQSDSEISSPSVFGTSEKPVLNAQCKSAATNAAGANSQIPQCQTPRKKQNNKTRETTQLSKLLQRQMQEIVDPLGVPFTVVWVPNANQILSWRKSERDLLCIYDELEGDALATFTHEIVEFKLKSVTKVYRTLINSLIAGYEKLLTKKKKSS